MSKIPIHRQILALTDEQLEEFVRDWTSHKKEYAEVQRFNGTGDLGRDVVGFLTDRRHEGPWHNYQCKQYGRTLSTAQGFIELGKTFYYSSLGNFTLPTAYFFVAPRGVNRNLKRYISKPTEFKNTFLSDWDKYCAEGISDGAVIPLTSDLRAIISAWNFSAIKAITVDELLADNAIKPVLQKWFDVHPGEAPIGIVPASIESHELPYVQQLLDAYSEREKCLIDQDAVMAHDAYASHLYRQRERFFDADSFSRFYRDNTMQQEIESLRRDIWHGISETQQAAHRDSLTRVDAVMTQAANIQAAGSLARYARVPVKQGFCHHFANEGVIKWRKT